MFSDLINNNVYFQAQVDTFKYQDLEIVEGGRGAEGEGVTARSEGQREVGTDIEVTTVYGMVPKGLLTFLGSLYKEGAKTTSGTLVYSFQRQTARRQYFFLPKTMCPQLRMQDFISGTRHNR